MNLPAVISFCLWTGAAMGALYLAFGILRAALGAGKLLTFFCDLIFCCLCGWAVVILFGPFVGAATRLLQRIFWKVCAFFRKIRAFLKAHFLVRREKTKENRRKTAKRPKKSVKKT